MLVMLMTFPIPVTRATRGLVVEFTGSDEGPASPSFIASGYALMKIAPVGREGRRPSRHSSSGGGSVHRDNQDNR
jgi:hypothetical protein